MTDEKKLEVLSCRVPPSVDVWLGLHAADREVTKSTMAARIIEDYAATQARRRLSAKDKTALIEIEEALEGVQAAIRQLIRVIGKRLA